MNNAYMCYKGEMAMALGEGDAGRPPYQWCVMCDEYSSKDSDPIVSWRVCVVWMRNLLSLWYHHRAHWGGMASIPTGNKRCTPVVTQWRKGAINRGGEGGEGRMEWVWWNEGESTRREMPKQRWQRGSTRNRKMRAR